MSSLCFARRVGPWLEWPSPRVHQVSRLALTHTVIVILLRRLRLTLPLSLHQCRCGRSRFFWPSSSCVRESGGSGKTGIRHRERGFTRALGRRRQGCNQRAVERLGSGRASCQGRTPIGDHRRWPPLVRRRAVCC